MTIKENKEELFIAYKEEFKGCDTGELRKEFDLIIKRKNKYRPHWLAKIIKNKYGTDRFAE
jgi:hypothetical protein